LSWSAKRSVAETFGEGTSGLYEDGSVLLETLAPPEAILTKMPERYGEGEYLVDRRRLRAVRVLRSLRQKAEPAGMSGLGAARLVKKRSTNVAEAATTDGHFPVPPAKPGIALALPTDGNAGHQHRLAMPQSLASVSRQERRSFATANLARLLAPGGTTSWSEKPSLHILETSQ
jgi:hypothetical protein